MCQSHGRRWLSNPDGHSFSLHLLSALAGFTHDLAGGQRYPQLCALVGLCPVTTGDMRWGAPEYSYTVADTELQCVLLTFDDTSEFGGGHKAGWTHSIGPGWTENVVSNGGASREFAQLFSNEYESEYFCS